MNRPYIPSPNRKYKIAVSAEPVDGKIPAGDPRWGRFNSSFINMELWPEQIRDYIYRGHAFTTWHISPRKSAHFICGQHYALDYDGGGHRATLDYLEQDPYISRRASMIYTTPSHTEEAPRARVLFLLEEPIDDPALYTAGAIALTKLDDLSDKSCKDPCRFFYGSTDCELYFLDNVMTMRDVQVLIDNVRAQSAPPPDATQYRGNKTDSKRLLDWAISSGKTGGRNNLGYWLCMRLRDDGYPRSEAEEIMRRYAIGVDVMTNHYSVEEAMATVRSAYGGGK